MKSKKIILTKDKIPKSLYVNIQIGNTNNKIDNHTNYGIINNWKFWNNSRLEKLTHSFLDILQNKLKINIDLNQPNIITKTYNELTNDDKLKYNLKFSPEELKSIDETNFLSTADKNFRSWYNTTNFLTNKKDLNVNCAYQMLFDIHNLCQKHKIKYWAEGGTLLGAIRHKGMIPWDDDIDIGMFEEDFNKLCQIMKNTSYSIVSPNTVIHTIGNNKNETNFSMFDKEKKNNKYKYLTLDIGVIIGLCNLVCPGSLCEYEIDNEKHNGGFHSTCIDVFIYSKQKNNSFYTLNDPENGVYESKKHYNPGSYFKNNELLPLKEYDFGNIKVMGANNPIPYLERSYGDIDDVDAWKKPIQYYDKNHQPKNEKNITENNFQCILPSRNVIHNKFLTPPARIVISPYNNINTNIEYMYNNSVILYSKHEDNKIIYYEIPIINFFNIYKNARQGVISILKENKYKIMNNGSIIIKNILPISMRIKNNKKIINHFPK